MTHFGWPLGGFIGGFNYDNAIMPMPYKTMPTIQWPSISTPELCPPTAPPQDDVAVVKALSDMAENLLQTMEKDDRDFVEWQRQHMLGKAVFQGYEQPGGKPCNSDGPERLSPFEQKLHDLQTHLREMAEACASSDMDRAITALHGQHSRDGRPVHFFPLLEE